MRYVNARYEEHMREMAYRIYMSDSLFYQAQGNGLTKRYVEILEDSKKPVETRTGDEIALDVINRHGLRIGKQ